MSTVDHDDPGAGTSARSRTRSKGAICYEFDADGETRRVRVSNTLDPTEFAIRDVSTDAREFDAALPESSLPGSGDRRDDCGDDFPALHCPDCGEPTTVGRTCRRSRCPRCHKAWVFYTARQVDAKTDGLRRLRYARSEGRSHPKLHHLVLSPPSSIRFDSGDPLDRAFDLVKLLLAQVDGDTGTAIYHPYRIKEEYRGDVLGHSSGDGDLTWKDVLPLIATEGWDAVREDYLVFSPHFHVIAVSDWIEGGAVTDRLAEKTGWVTHRITPGDSSTSIGDLEDLASVTAYSLSHAGLSHDAGNDRHRAAYRYFGEVANTEARANVTREVDRALRDVAPTVLGMDFPEPRCSEERVDADDGDGDAPDRSGSDGNGDGSGADVDRPPVRVLASGGDAQGWSEPSGSAVDLGADRSAGARNTGYDDSGGSATWGAPGSGAGTGAGGGDGVPAGQTADVPTSRCGSRLVPMRAAPDYLNDSEWCASIADATLRRLRRAHAEFLALGGGDTDPPPVPPPD
jgi:hypothetical protein